MIEQLALFSECRPRSFSDPDAAHINSWEIIWGWAGPDVGGFCEVNTPIVETEDGGRLYCYMERCRLIELLNDGRWLAEIDMGIVHGSPWGKDGTRLLLGITDIWPVVMNRVIDGDDE